MGWWSETILGGDTPLEIICDIEVIVDVPDIYPLTFSHQDDFDIDRLRSGLVENTDKLLDLTEDDCSGDIAAQVVACVVMYAGIEMDQRIKDKAIQACKDEDMEPWDNPQARRERLDQFVRAIEEYSGEATEITHEGLFQSFQRLL